MRGHPKVKSVTPLPCKHLKITFANGVTKVYDCTPLTNEQPFARLQDEALFRNVRADPAGYGVIWNDEIDLSEAELWIHGSVEPT